MINIDTRLLPKVDEKELWFLIHIVKRIGVNGTCWPSNATICKDTGWHIDTVQKIKKSLDDKGLLKVRKRAQTSNVYKVMTDYLGVYIPASEVEMDESPPTGNSGISPTGNTSRGGGENSGIEVLSNEVLTKEYIGATPPLKSLEDKKKEFGQSLVPFIEKYGKDIIREFYDHWTEDDGKYLAWEKAKKKKGTWNTSGRLSTWKKRDALYKPKNNQSELVPTVASNPETYRPA